MRGYLWDPVFRIVPASGAEVVYWLSDQLTDCGGHTRISLAYPEDMNVRMDINRSLRPVVFGIRPEVTIECIILSMADQAFLAAIESALLQPRAYSVFLSLDGGVVEREVVIGRGSTPAPINGKTVIGATFSLYVRAKDLISERPAMMVDPGVGEEKIADGGFEQWTDSSHLQAWTTTPTVLTLAQETTIVNTPGGSSAKVTRPSDGGSFASLQPPSVGLQNLTPRLWYRFRGSVQPTAVKADSFRIEIIDTSNGLIVQSDGKTWLSSSTTDLIKTAPPTGAFTQYEAWFRIPTSMNPSDVIIARAAGYWDPPQSNYYDDFSVYGPALRPGYATW